MILKGAVKIFEVLDKKRETSGLPRGLYRDLDYKSLAIKVSEHTADFYQTLLSALSLDIQDGTDVHRSSLSLAYCMETLNDHFAKVYTIVNEQVNRDREPKIVIQKKEEKKNLKYYLKKLFKL